MTNRKPMKQIRKDPLHGDVYEDPTFGVVSFSRTHGTPQPLVGSSIKHQSTIMMELKTAQLIRSLNMDRWFGGKLIARIEMSPTQFVDAITQLNCGEIPVTIRYTESGGHVEEAAPFESRVTQFDEEFVDDIKNVVKEFDDVISMAEDTKAQKRLIHAISQLKMHIEANMPFVKSQFSEAMEKTVTEAKGEIETMIESKIREIGIEGLRSQMPQLDEARPKLIDTGRK